MLDKGGIVDMLVGDEVIGRFFGGVSGPVHAPGGDRGRDRVVVRAGRDDATPMGAITIGAGIHTGIF